MDTERASSSSSTFDDAQTGKIHMKSNWTDVLKICQEKPEHKELIFTSRVTLLNDTILHLAVRNTEALEKLLNLPDDQDGELERALFKTNAYGNTPLHEAATLGYAEAAMLLVKKCDKLINLKNALGATALYRAAEFGQKKVLESLFNIVTEQQQVDPQQLEEHYTRKRVPILHAAVRGQHIGTALWIQKNIAQHVDPNNPFDKRKDEDNMTCLQLLANMPSVFKSGFIAGRLKPLTRFIYHCLPIVDDGKQDKGRRGWPMINDIKKKKKKHQQAVELATLLAQNDFSWEEICEKVSDVYDSCQSNDIKKKKKKHQQAVELATLLAQNDFACEEICEKVSDVYDSCQSSKAPQQVHLTPLLLAAKNGITEIVEIILDKYPQAIHHVSANQQNILHVAILHRQREIFRLVKKMTTSIGLSTLIRTIDDKGNTILHQVAVIDHCCEDRFVHSVLHLQDEMRWFNRVKKLVPDHFQSTQNSEGATPKPYFEATHRVLLEKAKTEAKETSHSCSSVGAAVATIVFAAAYAMPGGYEKGVPILFHTTLFQIFTIMDVISLGSALTSVVLFLSILASPQRYEDFNNSIPGRKVMAYVFLFISVGAAMIAFTATMLLSVGLGKEWAKPLVYLLGFIPLTIFALMYLSLLEGIQYALTESGRALKRVLPRCIYSRCFIGKTRRRVVDEELAIC